MNQILLHLIYIIALFGSGFTASFLVDAPTKRAVAKLRVLVAREESIFNATINRDRSVFTAEFKNGYRKLLDNFQVHIKRLEGK